MEAILGLIVGVLLTVGVIAYIKFLQSKKLASSQSIILLDKVKSVCKFITVEGDFAEIYHYQDVKQKFLKLIASKKKALVVVNAKAYIGFDLSKISMKANSSSKTLVLHNFPEAEVLSIETTLDYYDKKDGYYNTKQPFGKQGDFITAPKISNLFSEMIAIWMVSAWQVFGKPKNFNIIELGPGDGSLTKVMLNVFKRFPEFNSAKKN